VNSFRAKSEFHVGLVELLTTEGGSTWVHQVWTFANNKKLSKEQVEVTENTAKVVFKVLELLGVDPESPLTVTTKLPYDSYIYLLKFGSLVKVGGVKIQDKIHIKGRDKQVTVMDGSKTVYDRYKGHKTSLSLPSEFEGGLPAFQKMAAKDFTLLHLVRGTKENESWVSVQLREVAKLPLCDGAPFLPCRSHHEGKRSGTTEFHDGRLAARAIQLMDEVAVTPEKCKNPSAMKAFESEEQGDESTELRTPAPKQTKPADMPESQWASLMADIRRCKTALNNAKIRGKCTEAALKAKRDGDEARDKAMQQYLTRDGEATRVEVRAEGTATRAQVVASEARVLQALDEKFKPVADALGLGDEKTSQMLKLQRESIHAQEKKKRQDEKDERGLAKAVLMLEAQERKAAEEKRKAPSDPQEEEAAEEPAAEEPARKRRKAPVDPQTFHCELCDRSCPTQKVLDKHLGSKVHARAAALKQVRDGLPCVRPPAPETEETEEKKRRRELRVKKEHFDATFGSGVVGVDSEEDA
jgi:hypothetical protein